MRGWITYSEESEGWPKKVTSMVRSSQQDRFVGLALTGNSEVVQMYKKSHKKISAQLKIFYLKVIEETSWGFLQLETIIMGYY